MKSTLAIFVSALSCILGTSTAFRPADIHRQILRNQLSTDDGEITQNSSSRRAFLIASGLAIAFTNPAVSNAVYGADAKIEIPDIVQGMSDRTNKQCLVESLGNRECLVYLDPENQLYKGSDAKLLFERLGGSLTALKDLPIYIESKQWNKVNGVLTGPSEYYMSTHMGHC